jgi:hypothetical protein
MGEKGNASAEAMSALDAMPLDLIKSSPETVNAWLETYLNARQVQELRRVANAQEAANDAEGEDAGQPAG